MLVLDRKTPKLFPCHRSEKTLAKSNHCHTSKTHRNNLCVCHTSETPLGGLPISVRPKRGRKEHLSRHRSAPIPYPLSSFFSYSYALFGTTAVSQLFSNQPITHSFHRDGGCTSLCGYSVVEGRDHNILRTGVWPHTIPGHVL